MGKIGVFISHITEENTTATRVKEFLHSSFGADLPVFVSSDYESIAGGKTWFTTVVDALKSSAIELVLLSTASADRRWINFEAGVGVGADSAVIPVLIHGLEREDLGLPLSALQMRSLEDAANVEALLRDIGNHIGRSPNSDGIDALIAELRDLGDQSIGGWRGVEWQGVYLAVEGSILKLQERSLQAYQDEMGEVLKKAGFSPHLANRNNLGWAMGKGYKIVYMTDRKNFRAEIGRFDAILTAKINPPA